MPALRQVQPKRTAARLITAFVLFIPLVLMLWRGHDDAEAPSSAQRSSAPAIVAAAASGPVTVTTQRAFPLTDTCTSPHHPAAQRALPAGAERTVVNRSGLGLLRISNGTALDAVVVLVRLQNHQPLRAMFVPTGTAASFRQVPVGVYKVQYALGQSLDSRTWQFCSVRGRGEFDDTLVFTIDRSTKGIEYSAFELTLHKVRDGNASQTMIDSTQFVLPDPN